MAAGHTNWVNFQYLDTVSWVDDYNLLDDDTDYAYCTAAGEYIDVWGLDNANVPYGAKVCGIEIRARLYHTPECTAATKTMSVKVSSDGGTNYFFADSGTGTAAFSVTGTATNYDLGGTGDLWNPNTVSLSPSFRYPSWSGERFTDQAVDPFVAPYFRVRLQAVALKTPACESGYGFEFRCQYLATRVHWYYPEDKGPLSQLKWGPR